MGAGRAVGVGVLRGHRGDAPGMLLRHPVAPPVIHQGRGAIVEHPPASRRPQVRDQGIGRDLELLRKKRRRVRHGEEHAACTALHRGPVAHGHRLLRRALVHLRRPELDFPTALFLAVVPVIDLRQMRRLARRERLPEHLVGIKSTSRAESFASGTRTARSANCV